MKKLALLLCTVLLTACAQHLNKPDRDVPLPETRYRSLEVDNIAPPGAPYRLPATVYTPITLGPFPTVLVISGRGWGAAGEQEGRFFSEYFAGRGFAVVRMNPRGLDEAPFPAQLEDVREALRWIGNHAREYRLDEERLALLGFEAGGHLAALAGLSQSGDMPAVLGRRDVSLPVVRAVVVGGAPMDLEPLHKLDQVQRLLRQVAHYGGTPEQVSPLYLVHADAPPFFLFHGTRDGHVPAEQAVAMHAALDAAGVPAELYRMRMRGHTTGYLTMPGALSQAAEFLWREVVDPERYADDDESP